MISIEEIQAIWRQLKIPNRGEQIDAVELLKINLSYGSPLITVDEHNQRHLLVPIASTVEIDSDTTSNGIHVTSEQWGIYNGIKLYVDIKCLKPHLNDLFDLVLLDILDELISNSEQPDRVAHIVLERWRDLIQSEPSKLLKRQKIIGLYGELWFLRELTRLNVRAIDFWKGPSGGRYDFYTGKTAVEIKTSRKTNNKAVVIHGDMQLEMPPNGLLYLLYIQIETASKAQESFRAVISELIDLGCDQRKLYTTLISMGITSEVITQLDTWRINMLNMDLYLVDSEFPKITRSNFVLGRLPTGVTDIQYRINLSNIEALSKADYINLIQYMMEN